LTALELITDADFDWMLGRGPARPLLTLPPGGVDTEENLQLIRGMNAALLRAHSRGAWVIVHDHEVVGLCGYLRPPAAGEVEIGFGIAASRRNRGHATAAVGAMVHAATADPSVSRLAARTSLTNIASQRVLERNAFTRAGTDYDEVDGEMVRWVRVSDKLGEL
jgi:RimJ/RimL family protein N-acetyltransferase